MTNTLAMIDFLISNCNTSKHSVNYFDQILKGSQTSQVFNYCHFYVPRFIYIYTYIYNCIVKT